MKKLMFNILGLVLIVCMLVSLAVKANAADLGAAPAACVVEDDPNEPPCE